MTTSLSMNVVITGATGTIGSSVSRLLKRCGFHVVGVSRRMQTSDNCDAWCTWETLPEHINDGTAILNFAGENPGKGYWTEDTMNLIRDSRLDSIDKIKTAVTTSGSKPSILLQASAAGIYGDTEDSNKSHTNKGTSFRVACCKSIEDSIKDMSDNYNNGVVALRIGHPIISDNGLLQPLNIAGIMRCGSLGSGEQYYPWVHLDDVGRSVLVILRSLSDSDPLFRSFNICSPNPTTCQSFMKQLNDTNSRSGCWISIPSSLLNLMGPSSSVVTDSVKIYPNELLDGGFEFKYPDLREALNSYYIV